MGAELTVLHFHTAVEDVERTVVVGDDEHTGSAFVSDPAEQLHDLATAVAVECGGGFVCKD